MGIPDHFTYLLRNLYVDHEQTEMDTEQVTGSKLRREYDKTVYYYLAYLTLYAEYIMQNAGLDEAQAGIKIAGRNSNNSYMQMTSSYGRNQRGTKEPPSENKRGK